MQYDEEREIGTTVRSEDRPRLNTRLDPMSLAKPAQVNDRLPTPPTTKIPMDFPMGEYVRVLDEAEAIIKDRDAKGRNAETHFYAQFPHGHADISFELKRRVARILGAERQLGKMDVAREDALDLLNYAAFYVMLLDRESKRA